MWEALPPTIISNGHRNSLTEAKHELINLHHPDLRPAGKSTPPHPAAGLCLHRGRLGHRRPHGSLKPEVALLALLTAGLLQILSNPANDYGDAVKGSDKEDRIGPLRGMQKA